MDGGSSRELFEALILNPLQNKELKRPKDGKSLLIVLDAIDEIEIGHRDLMMQLLSSFSQNSPDWLYMFLTLRDDNQLVGLLPQEAQIIELKGTSEAMSVDIKLYLKEPMSKWINKISLEGALTQLVKNAQGSFLAAQCLKTKLNGFPQGTTLSIKDLAIFPTGLIDMYKEVFQKFHDHLVKRYGAKDAPPFYAAILEVLVVAKEPIDAVFLKELNHSASVDEVLEHLTGVVTVDESHAVSFHHKCVSEWLLMDKNLAPFTVNLSTARQRMAELVTSWIALIVDDSCKNKSVPACLQSYALKHALEHLTDVPKQQDNIAKILCCVGFVQRKLLTPGVTVGNLVDDYKHCHHQVTPNGGTSKLVTLESYMRKFPNLTDNMDSVFGFVKRWKECLSRRPESALQLAANYSTVPRIQENARIDLTDKPWIEDVTAIQDTSGPSRNFKEAVIDVDLSRDSRRIGVVTGDQTNGAWLHILNSETGELLVGSEPVDLRSIQDRTGSNLKFLPDNSNLFVGSLSTVVALKTGKPTPSGFDVTSVDLKDRFSIECCDAAGNFLVLGVTTLPFGGRSLHALVFDLKTKKCIKNIEVLKFRYGGSAQLGIKACSLSNDGSLFCACVKQTNKPDLKISIYSTQTWKVVHSADVEASGLTKCSFLTNQTLLLSGSARNNDQGSTKDDLNSRMTYMWNLENKSSSIVPVYRRPSTFYSTNTPGGSASQHVTIASWGVNAGSVFINRWKSNVFDVDRSDGSYVLNGTKTPRDLISTDKNVVLVFEDSVSLHRWTDLQELSAPRAGEPFQVEGVNILATNFVPRSDDLIVVHCPANSNTTPNKISSSLLNTKTDCLTTSSVWFSDEPLQSTAQHSSKAIFPGQASTTVSCSTTPDGATVVLNVGDRVDILDKSSLGSKLSLPRSTDFEPPHTSLNRLPLISCATSTKDCLVAIVYDDKPGVIFLFDLKSKILETPSAELRLESEPLVSHFSFLPANGNVISFHESQSNTLVVWNQRSGAQVNNQSSLDLAYASFSPASDRLALSLRSADSGALFLRSSDSHFNMKLEMIPGECWHPDREQSSAEFSPDGTVLIGLSGHVCRIWNAGNGEVLNDIRLDLEQTGTEIIGMLTNTHVLLYDVTSSLQVYDVASGTAIVSMPTGNKSLSKKLTERGWKISPKGGLVVGCSDRGELKIYRFHNIASIKMKTTLQRMKSLTKL